MGHPPFCEAVPRCDDDPDHEGPHRVWHDGPNYFKVVWLEIDERGEPIDPCPEE